MISSGRIRSRYVLLINRHVLCPCQQFCRTVRSCMISMTTCGLWDYILSFRMSSEFTDLGWPHNYLCWLSWRSFVVIFLGPEAGYVIHFPREPVYRASFDIDILTSCRFRCQSGPLTLLASWRFFLWGWCYSLPELYNSQLLDLIPKQHVIVSSIERKTSGEIFIPLQFIDF